MMDEQKISAGLTGRIVGRRLVVLPEVDSTNNAAFGLAAVGAPEGTAVISDMQVKGRGRLQRVWHSPPGANIYTSVVFRPAVKPADAPRMTIMAGVAVAETLERYCPGLVALKWPNDVQVRGKKICGILSEMKATADGVDFVVIGIGLNVNMRGEDFCAEIRDIATSLREETGRQIPREALAAELYTSLETWYKELTRAGFGPVKDRWLRFAGVAGQTLRVDTRSEVRRGEAVGMDDDGALLLRDESGRTRRIVAGDVMIERV